jgi:hypothetical protein
VPDSFVQLPADGAGKKLKTFADAAGEHYQQITLGDPAVLFRGRASTLRTPGRAGTTGQNLSAIWNGSATRVVRVKACAVDLSQSVVKAVTVLPPLVRFFRIGAAPTGGASATKNAEDTALTSDAGVAVTMDASADGTSAATAIAATTSGGALTQTFAPRLLAIGTTPATNLYEPFDREIFFDSSAVVLRPSQGLLLRLDYNVATMNPITDMWTAAWIWTEE